MEKRVSDEDYIGWLDVIWNRRLQRRHVERPSLVVGILLCPGFALMSLTGIVESLRHAGDVGDRSRQIGVQWEIIGDEAAAVVSSCGLPVTPTSDYLNPNDLDYLFAIGGLLKRQGSVRRSLRRYLQAASISGVRIVGVCTGTFLLAEEQLLKGHRACIHPFHREDFQLAFPGHQFTTHDDYVADDRIITVAGGISILSLMATIIGTHMGPDRSAKVVHQLSLPGRRDIGDFERTGLMRHVQVADARIQKALVLIEGSACTNLSVPEIARQVGMSERHFTRQFTREMGRSPKAHILRTQLGHCLWLLRNSGNSMTDIAYAGGFSSCSHFSTAFRQHYGMTPIEARAGTGTPPQKSDRAQEVVSIRGPQSGVSTT